MDRQFDLIIIGAGPGGLTAALYATRAGLKTALIEHAIAGGKLNKTFEISNWPGIENISGMELGKQMYEHALSYSAQYLYGSVVKVEDGEVKKVVLASGDVYEAKAIILATGTSERMLGIPGEKELVGRGVSYCAICDGNFFRNKTVTIIGGGNSALEEAIYLSGLASKIIIVIRRDEFRADEVIVKEILENPKCEVIYEHIPISLTEENGKLSSVILEHVKTKETMELKTDGLFPYIGADPNSSALIDLDVCDEVGYVKVNHEMETSREGIYAIGDVTVKTLRQVVTAASDGAVAAQAVFRYLKG